VKQLVNELGIQVIAVDGKSANGSYDRESGTKAPALGQSESSFR